MKARLQHSRMFHESTDPREIAGWPAAYVDQWRRLAKVRISILPKLGCSSISEIATKSGVKVGDQRRAFLESLMALYRYRRLKVQGSRLPNVRLIVRCLGAVRPPCSSTTFTCQTSIVRKAAWHNSLASRTLGQVTSHPPRCCTASGIKSFC